MRRQRSAVPAVQGIAGRLGGDQRAAIRRGGIDRAQVERDSGRDRWGHTQRNAAKARLERAVQVPAMDRPDLAVPRNRLPEIDRSEEHTSELQSLMRISYAVFCLTKKKHKNDEIHQ